MSFLAKTILIVWIHTVADFVLQTNSMAVNKSTSIKWLFAHVGLYTLCLCGFGWKYALVNGIAHFITDFVSSRLTTHFWKKGNRHNFFVVIGFDQALHITVLILTLAWFQQSYCNI